MKSKKTVDEYIMSYPQWRKELLLLCEIARSTSLTETLKWGVPVYSLKGKNVAGIAAFKSYVGIWFFQGALLTDKKKLLVNAQEGKTRALRQMRFYSAVEVDPVIVQEYLEEAIKNQEQGKEMKVDRAKPLKIPAELKNVFSENSELEKSFKQLSLTNKRDYTEYISAAKRPETKQKRLDKIVPMIIDGKGLNDKYKK